MQNLPRQLHACPENYQGLSRLPHQLFVPAKLFLETGETFDGFSPASQQEPHCGEVVFNTGMVGYMESLTDPSYAGQILTFTYPLIGNYGVSDVADWESKKIHVQGVVMSELAPFYSHYMAKQSLLCCLAEQKIPCIIGVDTRALTKRLRRAGVVSGVISTSKKPPKRFVDFKQIHWVKQVSIEQPIIYSSSRKKTIIAVDCGMKENSIRCLSQFPVRIKRVPYDYDYTHETYHGIFISNGPGDPALCTETIAILKKALMAKKPIFGICLGSQLMALATGARTYKLQFGHRSQNQPCLYLPTKKSYLTSQNHGYAIDEQTLSDDWQVIFRNLNDGTVAGIQHKKHPFFSVQFHPEASPGPMDTQWLFKKFIDEL